MTTTDTQPTWPDSAIFWRGKRVIVTGPSTMLRAGPSATLRAGGSDSCNARFVDRYD